MFQRRDFLKGVATIGVAVALPLFAAAKLPLAAEKLPEVKVYVSPKGLDTNPGTVAKPLKTIERALAVARDLPTDAPRAIVLADGTYPVEDPIKVTAADIAVTIRAANRGKAVLSGSVPVTGWTPDPHDAGILVAPMPFKAEPGRLYMLFDAGEPCALSTYPKKGRLHYSANEADGNWQWLNFRPEEFPADFDFKDLDLESVWLILPQEWATTRSYLDEIDIDGHRLHMKSKSGMELGKFNQGYTLLNTRLGLTEGGAWMCETGRGRILYRPKAGAKAPDCRLTRARCLFDIRDVRTSFALDGIVLEGCCTPFVSPGIWTGEPLCAAVSVKCARRVTVANCEIRNTAGAGVMFLKADTCTVAKCDVHNTGACCIEFVDGGAGNVEVSGCELHHGGILSASSPLLGAQISHIRIVGNHIHDGPGNGAVMWSRDSVFADNHVHHVMKVQRDGGGLYGGYCWTVVKNNHVHDTGAWPCLYADEGSQHSDFTKNRCEHWWPTHMHCTRFCTVTNNVFTCPASGHRFSFQGSGGGVFSDNQLLLGRNVTERDYLSLEACREWARNEVRLSDNAGKYQTAGKKSFKTGAKDPKDPLLVYRTPPAKGGSALYPSQLAEGGSMCGCPHTQVRADWDGAKVWFRFRTIYNALSGYFACRNIGGHVWGHWDGAKLVFENGLEVEVYPDGFARANRPDVAFGAGDTPHASDYRTVTFAVAIPLQALGLQAETAADKPVKFNVCCHNEDHRTSAWGWHPKDKDVLTGQLEFLP